MKELTITNKGLTIDSREIAEMMEVTHDQILRKLDGASDRKGIIQILADNQMVVSEYFIESIYKVKNNTKEYKCYLCTKLGCELLANKSTGEKGILFTAKYVKRFNEMESKEEKCKLPRTYKEALLQLVAAEEEKEKLQLDNKRKNQLIGELKPKADYTDTILLNPGLVTISQIAKDYGFSGMKFNELLHNLGVQYKQSNQWLLYSKYHDKGYTHSNTINYTHKDGTPDIKMNTKWTQKGRLFLYELLKENEILPLIEKKDKTA